jgi:3-oxoacyl-[acyl-carrier-protein] synthase-3
MPDAIAAEAAPAPELVPQLRRDAAIASVAASVPRAVLGNGEVAERIGVTPAWIESRTGVRERRIAAPGERLAALAAAAGAEALARAGVEPCELDLVLVATMAGDELLPNAAPVVAGLLDAEPAGAADVGAACSGFLSALSLAAAQVEARRADRVLVIGAELLARFVDRDDRATAALFGDGAGAALVVPASEDGGRIGPILLRADASGAGSIRAGLDERLIRMDGHDTFREAVRRLVESTAAAAARAGIELSEVDLFVYHQANARILRAVAERLGLDHDRVVDVVARYGNTSAASIPIALTEAESDGRLEPGATVLLGAFGAGFVYGAGIVEWGSA